MRPRILLKPVEIQESITELYYFYGVPALIDGKESRIIITNAGVSVDFRNGGSIHTNIIPKRLFPGEELTPDQIKKIIRLLEDSDLEGKSYSAEEMKEEWKMYREWKKKNQE